MKSHLIFILMTSVTLGISSCGPLDDEDEPPTDCSIDENTYAESDFTPDEDWDPNAQELNIAEEDPGALRIMTATSSDGTTWVRDHKKLIDQAGALDAVTDKEGRIFLYYTSGTEDLDDKVVVAVSEDDGVTWVHKYVTFDGWTAGKIVDTATINLADGTFRSYFMSAFPEDENPPLIRSAISCDGLTYTIEEGLRVDSLTSGAIPLAPKVMALNGETHLYLIDNASEEKNAHFVSSDGLSFTQEDNIDLDIILASSLTIGSQQYYYGQKVKEATGEPNFSIYYTTTADGYTYSTSTEVFGVEPDDSDSLDFFLVKKPVVVQLKDGTYLMFYLTGFKCEDDTTTPDADYGCP